MASQWSAAFWRPWIKESDLPLPPCTKPWVACEITVQHGRKHTVIVDREDAHLLRDYRWSTYTRGYLNATVDGERRTLHRLIARAGPGTVVDHVSGDINDNRRENLRVVSCAVNIRNQQARNQLGVKGVYKQRNGKYKVQIQTTEGKFKNHGTFATLAGAAEKAREVLVARDGEFARF